MNSQQIKELRKELKMTQQQLADAIKVSRVSVNYWENERKHPLPSNQFKLSQLRKKRENSVKRYEVRNRGLKQTGLMYAHNAQEACEKLGWVFEDCFVKELHN